MYQANSDATSDGSFLNKVDVYIDLDYLGGLSFVGDNAYSKSIVVSNNPINEGENSIKIIWENDNGDRRAVEKSFTN
ncbi:MAG: hypothetical protein MJE63_30225 [Proteobacteria bacterium]|nr:hypothetical protein [Pseudomonadota bacterium]